MEQMPSNAPIMESKPGPAGWFQTWLKAFTKPSEQTFIDITEDPNASSKTAFIWVFIVGTISGIVQAIVQGIYTALGIAPQIPGLEEFTQQSVGGDASSVLISIVTGICGAPLAGLLSVAFFALGVAIIQWIAKLFGGTGTFDKLAYGIAAISAPFTLVTAVLSIFSGIPYVGYCINIIILGLSFYVIYLQLLAVKAVNRFGWGPAIGAVFIPWFVFIFFCACLVVGGLALLGPIIGDTFNQINQGLTP